ncbi:hypothetical protein [Aureimonas frigidaquae]|uniref:hypothetical protein n=1 Tax=Aureimonas frigidaquae TaxID=424757 RepID=UPI000780B523|nr:hypothetical protein [Aureimonas frigidaquae]
MGDFDTDNEMMREQQARDMHGLSRQPQNGIRDIDARSEADRLAAHNADIGATRPDDDVLADNLAGLDPDEPPVERSGTWPPLASRGRSLLGD